MNEETSQGSRLTALMSAAQSGDKAAYAAALQACVPIAAAIARRQGHPADRVDDVVQEVLLTVHRALATYDPARPFLPWLRAIATRRSIDALRSHGRAGGQESYDPDAYLNHADTGMQADGTAGAREEAQALHAAIAGLSAGQREAILLIGLQEASLEQASRATGRSKGALKVNLHRALKTLRARMAPDRDAGGERGGDV